MPNVYEKFGSQGKWSETIEPVERANVYAQFGSMGKWQPPETEALEETHGVLDQVIAGYHERLADYGRKRALQEARRAVANRAGRIHYEPSPFFNFSDVSQLYANARGLIDPDRAVRDLQATLDKAAEHAAKAEEVPFSEETQRFVESKTFGDMLDNFWADPIGIIAEIGPRSAVASAPGLALGTVAGAAGGAVAGPPGAAAGFAAGMGVGSAGVEHAASLMESLREADVDLTDARSILDAVGDDELMQRVEKRAAIRAAVIGGFDAVAGGLATKHLIPGVEGPLKRELANAAAQMVSQAFLGGAGEAGAQVASGERLRPGEIGAEMAGEFVTAPVEVATAAGAGVRETFQARVDPGSPEAVMREVEEEARQRVRDEGGDELVEELAAAEALEPVEQAMAQGQAEFEAGLERETARREEASQAAQEEAEQAEAERPATFEEQVAAEEQKLSEAETTKAAKRQAGINRARERGKAIVQAAAETGTPADILRDVFGGEDQTNAVATNLGLSTVTDLDLAGAREEIARRMEGRFTEPVRVYHGGDLSQVPEGEVVSATLDRGVAERAAERAGEGARVYAVTAKPQDILFDAELFPGTFAEREVLVRSEVFLKQERKEVRESERQLARTLEELRAGTEPETRRMARYPLMNAIKKLGGLDPRSVAAGELRHMGATARRFPGLFRREGMKALDAIPAGEHMDDVLGQVEPGKNEGYIDENAILEALRDEVVTGVPLRTERELETIAPRREAREIAQSELDRLGISLDETAPLEAARRILAGEEGVPEEGALPTAEEISAAANEAATSPENELAEPTEGQIEAGNYQKGHVTLHGLDISIENPKGSTREGVGPEGPWSRELEHHYGYIRRTEGPDGDQVDVFIGEEPEHHRAFVVDQIDQQTGRFDEHKVMLGFPSQMAALRGYLANYEEGWKVGAITTMPMDEFKMWLRRGDTTKPVSRKVPTREYTEEIFAAAPREPAPRQEFQEGDIDPETGRPLSAEEAKFASTRTTEPKRVRERSKAEVERLTAVERDQEIRRLGLDRLENVEQLTPEEREQIAQYGELGGFPEPENLRSFREGTPEERLAVLRESADPELTGLQIGRLLYARRGEPSAEVAAGRPVRLPRESDKFYNARLEAWRRRQQQKPDEYLPFMRGFHGGPRDFEQFLSEHVGTGQGAASFGWGLYFTDERDIAEFYRRSLKPRATTVLLDGQDVSMYNAMELEESLGLTPFEASAVLTISDKEGDIKAAKEAWSKYLGPGQTAESIREIQDNIEAIDRIAARVEVQIPEGRGQVFEVELPELYELLDWNASLAEQPEMVKQAMRELTTWEDGELRVGRRVLHATMTSKEAGLSSTMLRGENFYRALEMDRGSRGASLALNEHGVRGHVYDAGTLSGQRSGARNFVIYDDAAIEIVDKYYSMGRRPRLPTSKYTDEHVQNIVEEVQRVEAAFSNITRSAYEDHGLFVVSDLLEVPSYLRRRVPKEAKAFYHPPSMRPDGTVGGDAIYIIADNVLPEETVSIMLHEGVAHKGLRYLFLPEDLDAFLDEVYQSLPQAVIDDISKVWRVAPDTPQHQRYIAEEAVAELAEEGDPRGILAKIVSAIRDKLRELGVVRKWTKNDIHAVLAEARRAMRGRPASEITVRLETGISETGEPTYSEQRADIAIRQADKRMDVLRALRECVTA